MVILLYRNAASTDKTVAPHRYSVIEGGKNEYRK